MRFRVLTVMSLLCLMALPALAQDKKAMSPEEQKMMETWMKAMTPGAKHQELADMAGDFTMDIKMWNDPSAPAQTATGTCNRKMVLGGRYLMETAKAEMMGMPFEGIGYTTYNNVTGEHDTIWMDNMSTAICMGSGKIDGNTCTANLTYANATTWKKDTAKTVFKMVDKDHQVFEWYENVNGSPVKKMEITYARAGKADAGAKTGSSGGGW